MAALAGPAQSAEFDKIRKAGEIVIAHRESSIPFSYVDADKKPVGYAVELCNRIAEAVGRHLKMPNLKTGYLLVTAANRIPSIVDGKASLECGSTTNTADRRKQVDFTIPHYIASARLLVRSESSVGTLQDLAGRTVTSTKETTPIKTLARLNAEYVLNLKIVEAADHAQGFANVVQGKAEAFAMDDVLLFGLRANAEKPDAFKVVGKPMTIEPYAIMLPKGDAEFKKLVDDEMRRLISTGTLQQLYAKWFTQPIPPKGINMQLTMPALFRDSLKYPSDKVDLAN